MKRYKFNLIIHLEFKLDVNKKNSFKLAIKN